MDDKIQIDRELVADLTVGELEELETRTGRPLSKLFDVDAPRGILLRTLAYIVMRRDDPSTTWEQSADARVSLAPELEEEEVVATTADPTVAGRGRRRG